MILHGQGMTPNRSDIEPRYRDRVQACKAAYQNAQAESDAAGIDFVRRAVREPDDSQAYRNALVAECQALRAYMKALLDMWRR